MPIFERRKLRKRPIKDPSEYKSSLDQIMAYMLVPFRGLYIMTLILSLLQATLLLTLPVLAGTIIDDIREQGFYGILDTFTWLIICMGAMALVWYIRLYANQFMGNCIIKNLRNDIFLAIMRASYGFLDHHSTGDLMARCTSDLNTLKQLLSSQITMFIRQIFTVVAALIGMAIISLPLSLCIYPMFPVIFYIIYKFKKKIGPAYRESRDIYGELTSVVEENISGVRVVRSFATESYEIRKFHIKNMEYYNKQKYLMKLQSTFEPTVRFLVNLAVVIVVFVGGTTFIDLEEHDAIGKLFTFVLILNFAVDPLFFINTFLGNLALYRQVTDRICEILNNEKIIPEKLGKFELTEYGKEIYLHPRRAGRLAERLGISPPDENGQMMIKLVGDGVSDPDKLARRMGTHIDLLKEIYMKHRAYVKYSGAKELDVLFGKVEFNDVWLSYNNNDYYELKEITFKTKPGEIIAILGATGSGKTSLIRLIGRFYEIAKGSILIDGMDIREVTKKSLRSKIGFVPQESFLFSRSIKENLTLGRPDADMEEIIRACKLANIHDFIMSLPDGYDTIVGQRGITLSGGQRQRISIARALIIKPRILILDDATSSVDVDTEYKIQQTFKEMFENTTTFIITQRLSTVKNADRIMVLDKGRIAQFGTHEELMRDKDGIYYKLYSTLKPLEKMAESSTVGVSVMDGKEGGSFSGN